MTEKKLIVVWRGVCVRCDERKIKAMVIVDGRHTCLECVTKAINAAGVRFKEYDDKIIKECQEKFEQEYPELIRAIKDLL